MATYEHPLSSNLIIDSASITHSMKCLFLTETPLLKERKKKFSRFGGHGLPASFMKPDPCALNNCTDKTAEGIDRIKTGSKSLRCWHPSRGLKSRETPRLPGPRRRCWNETRLLELSIRALSRAPSWILRSQTLILPAVLGARAPFISDSYFHIALLLPLFPPQPLFQDRLTAELLAKLSLRCLI